MHINMTSDYAIRCLLTLAAREREMSSSEISEAIGVTRALTMNILRRLRTAGFVNSGRGANGGYWLAKDKSEISLLDVLKLMEESMCVNHCLNPEQDCSRRAEAFCLVRKFYEKLQEDLHRSLDGMTLEKLLAQDAT